MKKKSVVLLSGGLDSLANLALALSRTKVVLNLTFDYGQKAVLKEIFSSKKISKYYKIPHKIVKLPWMDAGISALTSVDFKVPRISQKDLDGGINLKASRKVWVSNRNGVFINIAAYFAETLGADFIVAGFNKEEAGNFPDNSVNFIKAVNKSLSYSTKNKVRVKSFTQNLTKEKIIKAGSKLDVPWKYLWSCYEGGKNMCGSCESCQRLKRALKSSGLCIFFNFTR